MSDAIKQALLALGWKQCKRGHLHGIVCKVPTRAVFKKRAVRLDTRRPVPYARRYRIGGAFYGQCKIVHSVVIIGGTVIK